MSDRRKKPHSVLARKIPVSNAGQYKARLSKADAIIKALSRKRGATIEELCKLSGWQRHSIHGFLSGTLRKKRGLVIAREVGKDGVSKYRIEGLCNKKTWDMCHPENADHTTKQDRS